MTSKDTDYHSFVPAVLQKVINQCDKEYLEMYSYADINRVISDVVFEVFCQGVPLNEKERGQLIDVLQARKFFFENLIGVVRCGGQIDLKEIRELLASSQWGFA